MKAPQEELPVLKYRINRLESPPRKGVTRISVCDPEQPILGPLTQKKDKFRAWFARKASHTPYAETFVLYLLDVHDGIMREIESSRRILELPEDWDGEGGRGYSKAAWDRAVRFVIETARAWQLALGFASPIPVPQVLPAGNGSIDIHWKEEGFELLVNVPAETNAPASFYGDDYGKLHIKGTIDPEKPTTALALWLSSHHVAERGHFERMAVILSDP